VSSCLLCLFLVPFRFLNRAHVLVPGFPPVFSFERTEDNPITTAKFFSFFPTTDSVPHLQPKKVTPCSVLFSLTFGSSLSLARNLNPSSSSRITPEGTSLKFSFRDPFFPWGMARFYKFFPLLNLGSCSVPFKRTSRKQS